MRARRLIFCLLIILAARILLWLFPIEFGFSVYADHSETHNPYRFGYVDTSVPHFALRTELIQTSASGDEVLRLLRELAVDMHDDDVIVGHLLATLDDEQARRLTALLRALGATTSTAPMPVTAAGNSTEVLIGKEHPYVSVIESITAGDDSRAVRTSFGMGAYNPTVDVAHHGTLLRFATALLPDDALRVSLHATVARFHGLTILPYPDTFPGYVTSLHRPIHDRHVISAEFDLPPGRWALVPLSLPPASALPTTRPVADERLLLLIRFWNAPAVPFPPRNRPASRAAR